MKELKNRYPGAKSFTTDESELFFGRDHDIEKLYNLINLEKLVLVYSKSGIGKSSLLNAGLIPKLDIDGTYLKYLVRFYAYNSTNQTSPYSKILEKIKSKNSINNILTETIPFHNSLWFHIKNIQIENVNKTILLVFDQFEELFTYPENHIIEFKRQISDLLFTKIPSDIRNLIEERIENNLISNDDLNLLNSNINIKVLFLIRSDRMSLLNKLKDSIPNILNTVYELDALTGQQAQIAISCPAEKSGNFKSNSFSFTTQSIYNIIDFLTDKGNHKIETFQLQILCQYCEDLIIKKQNETNQILEINEFDLNEIDKIYKNYYDNIIINSPEKYRLQIQKLIEEELIVNHTRVTLADIVIFEKLSIPSEILEYLVSTHIIRAEPNSVGGRSYEISHDTLVAPILISFEKRHQQELYEMEIVRKEQELLQYKIEQEKIRDKTTKKNQRKIIVIVSAAAIVSIVFGIFALVLYFDAQKAKNEAEYQTAIAEQKEEEANQAIFNLKKSEFTRILSESEIFCKNLQFADAISKLEEAYKWTDDSLTIKNKIDSIYLIGNKEKQFNDFIAEAEIYQKNESTWLLALETYTKALELGFNNVLVASKIATLQSMYNTKLSFYKTGATEWLNKGGTFKQYTLDNFIYPGLLLNPNDVDLIALKKQAENP